MGNKEREIIQSDIFFCLSRPVPQSYHPEFTYLVEKGLFSISKDLSPIYIAKDFFGILNLIPSHRDLLVSLILNDDDAAVRDEISKLTATTNEVLFRLLYDCGYISDHCYETSTLPRCLPFISELLVRYV